MARLLLILALCLVATALGEQQASSASDVTDAQVGATQEVGVPDVVAVQMRKIEKIIKFDSKKCTDEVEDLKTEISKRQLKITKFENTMTTIRASLSVNKKQLASEVNAIAKVKAMVMEALKIGKAPTAGEKAAVAAQVANLDKEGSGSKMVGVLRNIVESVGSGRMEYDEILKLLDQLAERLQKAIGSDPVETEIKTYQNKIQVTNGDIVELKQKLHKVEAQCELRNKEFKEVVVVLKLIKQKFGDVKVANCKPMADQKESEMAKIIKERDSLKSQLEAMTVALKACEKGKPAHEQCKSDHSKCSAEKESLAKEVERLKTVEGQVKDHVAARTEMEQKLSKCTSEKTTIEGKLTEVRATLATTEEKAKCTQQEETNEELNKHVKVLEVKLQLLDKCDAKYKSISTEKTELIRQLEKMSILHRQLEKCHFDASTASKTCASNALEASQEHSASIDRLTVHLKAISAQIKTLQEAAKCTTERSKIETYEKEVSVIKTETKTVVTQVQASLAGCQAEVQKVTSDVKSKTEKVEGCEKTADTCKQQLNTCKASHAVCIKGHTETKAACAKVDAELSSCQASLRIETEKVATIRKVKDEVAAKEKALDEKVVALTKEETELKTEVTTLTKKVEVQEGDIVKKTGEIKELSKKEEELAKAKTTLTQEITVKTTKIEEVTKQITTIESQLKTTNEGAEELKKEILKLQTHRENLTKEKVDLDGRLEKLKVEIATQVTYRKAAEEQLTKSRTETVELKKKIEELNSKIEKSNNDKSSCEKEKLHLQGKIKELESELKNTKAELKKCAEDGADLRSKLAVAEQKAKCDPHKAAIRELKHANSKHVETIKGLTHSKEALERELVKLRAKLQTWEALIHSLKHQLTKCTHGHVGCKSNVKKLEQQMLQHLRNIKKHVTNISRLEEKLAGCQVELLHTKKQWHKDRRAYKVFKDNLLEQMARLIALAKDAKHKFDVARAAMRNELKVQDSQWGVCRKEVLNYERMLGTGVVKAEKEKLKLYEATRKYADMKKAADVKIARAVAEAAKAKHEQAAALKAKAELDRAYKRVNRAVEKDSTPAPAPAPVAASSPKKDSAPKDSAPKDSAPKDSAPKDSAPKEDVQVDNDTLMEQLSQQMKLDA